MEVKNHLLKDEKVNQEIREELKIFRDTNENEDRTIQNLWDIAKALNGCIFILISFYESF